MRIRHLAAVIVGAGLVLAGPAALAATYPPSTPSIAVSATVVNAGQGVTVTGHGFAPLSAVTVSWTGSGSLGASAAALPMGVGGLKADSTGAVKTTITFSSVGAHVISLTGRSPSASVISLSTTVTVRGAAAGGSTTGGDLPRTGFPLLELVLGAVGLVLIGALVVAALRRHRSAAAAGDAPAEPQPLQPTH